MSVSMQQRITLAYAAGFRGDALATIVSISLCECGVGSSSGCEYGCNPDAAGVSCGVLQVYQPAHPGTATCASDPACCFRLGWDISSGGTNFHPWSTYNNGCYLGYMAAVRAAIASGTGPPPPPPPGPLCPAGYTWDGTACVPAGGPPPPAPPPPSSAADSSGGLLAVILVGAGVGGGWIVARHRRGASTAPRVTAPRRLPELYTGGRRPGSFH